MRLILALALALLAACGPRIPTGPAIPYTPGKQPGYPRLGAAIPAGHTRYDNGSLADLLVKLTHDLEWGTARPHLIRFEGPVHVSLVGDGALPYVAFFDGFLGRFRRDTGIDISRGAEHANIEIRFVPGQEFRAEVPQHFCVVAPGLIRWERFRQSPIRHGTRAYETQRSMEGMTIFIPDNAAPYVVRTCLIEELVQALGPANDLYGLGPSIFNDDAAHIWPTRLDILMLKVLYAPEIRSGMTRGETWAAARTALDRLNPDGAGAPPLPLVPEGRMSGWTRAIRTAFDRTKPMDERLRAAERAVEIAQTRSPDTAYHCRALAALARLGREQRKRVMPKVVEADRVCARAHGEDDIRVARILLDVARLHYDAGNPAAALALTEDLEDRLAAHAQDERLTALYALRAAALRAIQQGTRSFEAQRLAGEWGAYSLGVEHPTVRRWRQK